MKNQVEKPLKIWAKLHRKAHKKIQVKYPLEDKKKMGQTGLLASRPSGF